MEIFKKGLIFAEIPYAVLKVYLPSMFRACPFETVKLCIVKISNFFLRFLVKGQVNVEKYCDRVIFL